MATTARVRGALFARRAAWITVSSHTLASAHLCLPTAHVLHLGQPPACAMHTGRPASLSISSFTAAHHCSRSIHDSSLVLVPHTRRLSTHTDALTGAAAGGVKYKGATWDKRAQKWRARITVNGTRIDLGTFDDAKTASDAYFAARSVHRDQQYAALRTGGGKKTKAQKGQSPSSDASDAAVAVAAADGEEDGDGDEDAAQVPQSANGSKFTGVHQDAGASMWEAVIRVGDKEISGGEYPTEEEAARAYDALARMYIGKDAKLNFPIDPYAAWVPPEEVVTTGQIETKVGVPLAVDEIVAALQQERGIDVRAVPLAGRSDLAEQMVFVTGRSVQHMRKMADMLSRALRKRHLPGVDPTVEARDMDDWMVVDAGNIIINIMDKEAREAFDLEKFYENMKLGEDPYAGLTFDEWLERNPVPEVWLQRLARDEEEMAAEQRMPAPPTTLLDSVGPTFGKNTPTLVRKQEKRLRGRNT